ncbi:hypothetical protein DFH09DRAFT_1209237, partial [Mycena vulgaris]
MQPPYNTSAYSFGRMVSMHCSLTHVSRTLWTSPWARMPASLNIPTASLSTTIPAVSPARTECCCFPTPSQPTVAARNLDGTNTRRLRPGHATPSVWKPPTSATSRRAGRWTRWMVLRALILPPRGRVKAANGAGGAALKHAEATISSIATDGFLADLSTTSRHFLLAVGILFLSIFPCYVEYGKV